MSGFDDFAERRSALAARLRTLRLEVGLSGSSLGVRAGMSQSKISKIELGRLTPSDRDVAAILRALNLDDLVSASLLAEARSVALEWRRRVAAGASLGASDSREHYEDVEQAATSLDVFSPLAVPTLLKTPASIAEMLRISTFWRGNTAQVEWVMRRQAQLYNETKRYRFLVLESTLKLTYGSNAIRADQVRFLLSFFPRPNAELRVLRAASPLPRNPVGEFVVLDDEAVGVEVPSGQMILRNPVEVAYYVESFQSLWEIAVSGDEVGELLESALPQPVVNLSA